MKIYAWPFAMLGLILFIGGLYCTVNQLVHPVLGFISVIGGLVLSMTTAPLEYIEFGADDGEDL